MTQPTPKRIALLGPFGFGNLGDAAIQQAMIQNIHKRFPNCEVFGISLNPEDTEERHHIRSYPIGRHANGWGLNHPPETSTFYRSLHYLRFKTPGLVQKIVRPLFLLINEFLGSVRALLFLGKIDLLIISGGGQLDDYWGGPYLHPYYLMVWSVLARLRHVPYLVVSVGAGPLDAPLSRRFDRYALSLASYRSYRDEKSKRYMATVAGFQRDDPVYPDLAFSLQGQAALPQPGQGTRPMVVVGPMAYFDPRIWPEKDQIVYGNYLNKLAAFVQWLLEKGYKIVFVPGEAVHDLDVINDLKELLARAGVDLTSAQVSHPPVQTVDDLMPHLASADFVLASRFHGVLLTLLLARPLVALSYHSKIDELMKDTGQGHYCLQIHDFDLDTLKARFTELVANRNPVSEQIAARVSQYRTALDEQYDRIFGHL